MRISVIIAVYNTEQYLPECLDSLLRQTYQDWEAWCVDDCSTDDSLKVLKNYAEKDSRFHVVEMPENRGLAVARNTAIRQCEGDLVAFLDSDDWLSDDGLNEIERTFHEHPNTGCVLWDCKYVYSDHIDTFDMPDFEVMAGREAFEKSLTWTIHGVYVTTAEIHKKYLYDETAKWYSDENTTRMHYLASTEVRKCSGVYYYRQRENSVTHSINIHHFDMLEANSSMRQQLRDVNIDEETLTRYEEVKWRNIVDCYFYFYMNRKSFSGNERKMIKSRIKKAFSETEFQRIPSAVTRKFGYSTMFRNWSLFHLQEELYFRMRGLIGKNIIITILLLLMMLNIPMHGWAQDMSKMSRYVRNIAISQQQNEARAKQMGTDGSNNKALMTALVRTDSESDEVFAKNHCRCLGHYDDIHIVAIPVNRLAEFSQFSEIKRIESKEACSITVDTVRIINNVNQVHSGEGVSQAYSGKGVVVGVEDIGFDLTHPTFYSSDMQDYRIRRFWDMLDYSDWDGTNPDSLENFVIGKYFTSRETILEKAYATDGLIVSHGTHTTGAAAGSGSEGNGEKTYSGMAPEADIVLVANATNTDAEFIPEELEQFYTIATDLLGFKYIFDYAESVGKPCVVSFSEGTYEDMYGDCQLQYEVLERMTGPGRIIVASAGNQSIKYTYLHKAPEKEEATSLVYGSKNAYYTLRGSDHFKLRLSFFNGTEHLMSFDYSTKDIIQQPDSMFTEFLNVENRKVKVMLAAYPSCYDETQWVAELLLQSMNDYSVGQSPVFIALSLLGEGTDVEAFISGGVFMNRKEFPQYQQAERTHNIHFPSSAPSVICVGNSAWRRGHINYNGVWKESDAGSDGVRAISSSVGPTMMGLTKPDVMAPGMNVISAYSSYYLENNPEASDIDWDVRHFEWNGRTYPWNSNSGTSMSAPIVSGIIALWLEANPELTPQQAMEAIKATSRHCVEGITYPNNEYGYGEIDAYAGLLYVLGLSGIKDISANHPEKITIRPSGSGIVITADKATESDIFVTIYNINGGIVARETLAAGQAHYTIVPTLAEGVYAVQCKSNTKELCGSELIRISK